MSATRTRATMGNLDRNNLKRLIAFAKNVVKLMTGAAASYPNTATAIAALAAAIAALQKAIDDKLTAQAKEAKRILLVSALEGVMSDVQQLVDTLSPQEAASLVTGAGFVVHADPVHNKHMVTVSQAYPGAPIEISAFLSAIAPGMLTHKHQINWRFLLPGGPAGTYFNWTGPTAKTTLPTIPPAPPAPVVPVGTMLVVECAVSDKKTMTAWFSSQPYKVE